MRSIENFKKKELNKEQLEKIQGGTIVLPLPIVADAVEAIGNAIGEALYDWFS
ncbi:bacteriocin [Kordia sp.]|uniref:bacteriocin n=1 Tax=Kordia sp. TaxID=1965332 RepID=UPI003D6C1619